MDTASGLKKVELAYDFMSRRVRKAVSAYDGSAWNQEQERLFVYNGWNLLRETTTTDSGTSTEYYVWGLDLSGTLHGAGGVGGLLSKTNDQTSQTFQYLYDANGNVGQLLNAADGSLAAHYEYDPFGNVLVADGPEALKNPIRFSTKYLDAETGWYYYGFRYYDPVSGRWPTRDPLGEQGGVNLYAFVRNRASNEIDKLGLLGHRIFAEEDEKEYYSCNCGWIDNSHANTAKNLYDAIIDGINQYEGNRANDTFVLGDGSMGGAFLKVSYTLTFDGSLDPDSTIQLALDIFFDFKGMWENFQGELGNLNPLTGSSFSVDDHPSDFLGFMEAAGKIHIQNICPGLSPEDSQRMFDYGRGPSKNKSHKPKLWNYDDLSRIHESQAFWYKEELCDPCKGKNTDPPDIFNQYKLSGNFPGPKGFIRNGIADQQTVVGNFKDNLL